MRLLLTRDFDETTVAARSTTACLHLASEARTAVGPGHHTAAVANPTGIGLKKAGGSYHHALRVVEAAVSAVPSAAHPQRTAPGVSASQQLRSRKYQVPPGHGQAAANAGTGTGVQYAGRKKVARSSRFGVHGHTNVPALRHARRGNQGAAALDQAAVGHQADIATRAVQPIGVYSPLLHQLGRLHPHIAALGSIDVDAGAAFQGNHPGTCVHRHLAAARRVLVQGRGRRERLRTDPGARVQRDVGALRGDAHVAAAQLPIGRGRAGCGECHIAQCLEH